VKGRDANVRLEGEQCSLERITFAMRPDSKALQGPRVDRRRPFVRPEAATTAGGSSDADPGSVRQANYRGATVQDLDARAFEGAAKCDPAQ